MEAYLIDGGRPLDGVMEIHGAKNSVLPIMAACVCCAGTCEIRNCPRISDVETAVAILRHLGCRVERRGGTLAVDAAGLARCDIPAKLMRDMRSSILFLGALLARCGRADLVLPGGCALGARPVDLHLQAMGRLGARAEQAGDRITCRAGALRGQEFTLRFPSVGATENAMLAALGCRGTVVLRNAAREPEIVDLAQFLRVLGAQVSGEGTDRLTVQGGAPLHGAAYTVMPDRIETATYLCAAAGCGGDVFLAGAERRSLEAVISVLGRSGCQITEEASGLRIQASGRLTPPGSVATAPHPGFPTDAQAPVMAAMLRAAGTTGFTETIFENRMRHVPQLRRLGADIKLYGRRAVVRGVGTLRGADMEATDLRCGAALIVAALQAEGESRVTGVPYIRRGYEALAENLRNAGAAVTLQNE